MDLRNCIFVTLDSPMGGSFIDLQNRQLMVEVFTQFYTTIVMHDCLMISYFNSLGGNLAKETVRCLTFQGLVFRLAEFPK